MMRLALVVVLLFCVLPVWAQGTGVGYVAGLGTENFTVTHSIPLVTEPVFVSGDALAAENLFGLGASVRTTEPLEWLFARCGLKMSPELQSASRLVHLGGGFFAKDWNFEAPIRAGGYVKLDLLDIKF